MKQPSFRYVILSAVILSVVAVLSIISFPYFVSTVSAQNQTQAIPNEADVFIVLFSAQHESVVGSKGRLGIDDSKNSHMAEINGTIYSPLNYFLTNDGMILGNFRIHFLNLESGVMQGGIVPDVVVRGSLDLSDSSWNTIFVREINSNGEVYNTFYRKVGKNYEVIYPKTRVR